MSRLIRIFLFPIFLMMCLVPLSCDDGDVSDEIELQCDNYFLTKETVGNFVQELYYNDEGLIDVVIQTIGANPPERHQYSYNSKRQLTKLVLGTLFYAEYSYDDEGLLDKIRVFQLSNNSLYSESDFFYTDDNKISRYEMYSGVTLTSLTSYSEYEYPEDNKIEIRTFNRQPDESYQEVFVKYTMDSNRNPYPSEYFIGQAAWSNPGPQQNIVSFEKLELGITTSAVIKRIYNEDGYPVSYSNGQGKFEYACEPVKEP